MAYAIETFALTKIFPPAQGWMTWLNRRPDPRPAVNEVSLAVGQGELFGLLGPNGAGKTTLIKLLATLIVPTRGTARVDGFDLRQEAAVRASLGLATSDERSFYWRLTGRQNLEFFAALQALPPRRLAGRVQTILELLDLAEIADTRFQTYSTGMRQRLAIARALLHEPRILFLDEPTKGLDPTATRQLHHLIRETLVNQQGITVFLSTHLLEEAERLCDRVAVLHRGQVRGSGTIPELRRELGLVERYQVQVQGLANTPARQIADGLRHSQMTPLDEGEALIAFDLDGENVLDDTLAAIRQAGGKLQAVSQQQASLETIFERLIGEANRPLPPGPSAPAVEKPALAPPPAPASPRRNAHPLHIAWAFLKRDYYQEASYRVAFLLQFISIFLWVVIFYFIAQLIGPSASPYLTNYGGDYLSFVLIGLAFSGYFGVGLSGFASSLRQAQTTGTLEAMLTTTTPLSMIVLASALWDYLLTTLRVGLYLGLGAFLGVNLGGGNYLGAFIVLLLSIVAFASLGIVAASIIMVIKRGEAISWAFNAGSNLLGGMYYPINVLPAWMQWAARLLPLTYALESMRRALLQGASLGDLAGDIGILALFCILLLPSSLFAFRYAVRRAKIDGSLTHY